MQMLDLFSGLGGFSVAASWVWPDHETVAFCEIDPRRQEFLSRAWPGVPIHDDIRTLNGRQWPGAVDLVCAGVPCQPASRAGKQRGPKDDRWLWDEALRVLAEVRPRWALFENPPGIKDVGLDGILAEVAGIGYEVGIADIPACAVNAPHLRHRLWIICALEDAARHSEGQCGADGQRAGQSSHACNLADADEARRQGRDAERGPDGLRAEHRQGQLADTTPHDQQHDAIKGASDARVERRRVIDRCGGVQAGAVLRNQWGRFVWVPCADGKFRRAPDDSQRMAHGLPVELSEALAEEEEAHHEEVVRRLNELQPHRSLLAALGDSIVPQVAAEVMRAIKAADEG